jgi:hypothetical protein
MGSIIGIRSGTEEVPYEVLQSDGPFEIRQYGDRIVIETFMKNTNRHAESSAFRTLAAFIFGANSKHEKIAMTSPVEERPNDRCRANEQGEPTETLLDKQGGATGWIMRFTLPHDLKIEDVPKPLDHQNVNLSRVQSQVIATLRFSGSWSESAFEDYGRSLESELQKTKYRTIGPIAHLKYDPPWTITCFRRNEVAFPVMLVDSS